MNERGIMSRFLSGEIYINCKTEDTISNLMRYLDKKGITWYNGQKLIGHNGWEMYGVDNCYKIQDSCLHIYNIKHTLNIGSEVVKFKIDNNTCDKIDKFDYTYKGLKNRGLKAGDIFIDYTDEQCFIISQFRAITKKEEVIHINEETLKNIKGINIENDLDLDGFLNKKAIEYRIINREVKNTMYYIEHTVDGKTYEFRANAEDDFTIGEFVICNTYKGQTFGRVVDIKEKTMKLKKYESRRIIEKIK